MICQRGRDLGFLGDRPPLPPGGAAVAGAGIRDRAKTAAGGRGDDAGEQRGGGRAPDVVAGRR